MCGIVGLIRNDAYADTARLCAAAAQLLYHRGPDDGGVVAFSPDGGFSRHSLGRPDETTDWSGKKTNLALGARRLAIIDRSPAGHQPMSSDGDHTWAVFNGEIYNHVELRGELAARGLTFRGSCDTEVILAGYRAWGADVFTRLRGMWAVAIVDRVAGRVVLSRDPLGIKPLYLAPIADGYAFASEIKALLSLPGVARDANEPRLRDFLVAGLIDHTNDTLYDSIWSLEPGCRLEIDLRPASLTATLGRLYRDRPVGTARAVDVGPDSMRQLLDDSLRVHLRSDVPIGSCLSGGLDSSAIVASLARIARDAGAAWSQHTFSAVLPGDPLDESSHVDAVLAAHRDLQGHRVTPDPARLPAEMDRIIWHQDEPFASPSIFMQWEVMRLARECGMIVLLDGQGGDELFAGYPGCVPPYLAHLVTRIRWLRAMREWRAFRASAGGGGSLAAHAAGYLLPQTVRVALRRGRDRRRNDHLAPELLDAEETVRAPFEQRMPRGIRALPPCARGTWNRFTFDLALRSSLPALLHYEDRNSMAFSIEARVPFLDRPLIEYALALPPDAKLRDGRAKAILRDAMTGRVPPSILARNDKIGFAAPTTTWMRGPLRGWWRDLIGSRSLRERSCFNMTRLERLASRFDAGDDAAALPLWRVAIVEQWARRMLDRPVPAS